MSSQITQHSQQHLTASATQKSNLQLHFDLSTRKRLRHLETIKMKSVTLLSAAAVGLKLASAAEPWYTCDGYRRPDYDDCEFEKAMLYCYQC
jgi:hypothetical protein